jgi:hypothetical protein
MCIIAAKTRRVNLGIGRRRITMSSDPRYDLRNLGQPVQTKTKQAGSKGKGKDAGTKGGGSKDESTDATKEGESKDAAIEPYILDARKIGNSGQGLTLDDFSKKYFLATANKQTVGLAYFEYLKAIADARGMYSDPKYANHLNGMSYIEDFLNSVQLDVATEGLGVMLELIQGAAPKEKVVELAIFLEDAPKIEETGNSTLEENMGKWVHNICSLLDGGLWKAKQKTPANAQKTRFNCKDGTTSLDFQGIREGTEGTFWIDLQGQVGKEKARGSYCQVLIETCVGRVSEEMITKALLMSLKNGRKRALIHKYMDGHDDGLFGRPNKG